MAVEELDELKDSIQQTLNLLPDNSKVIFSNKVCVKI